MTLTFLESIKIVIFEDPTTDDDGYNGDEIFAIGTRPTE